MTTPQRTAYTHGDPVMPDHRQSVAQLLRDADAFLLNLQRSMSDLRVILARSSDMEATTLSNVSAEVIPLVANITTTAIAAGAVLAKLPDPIDGQEILFNLGERLAYAFNPSFRRPLSERIRAHGALESSLNDIRDQVVLRQQVFR